MRQVIFNIFSQLTAEYPFSECFRLQTFMVVDKIEDITEPDNKKLFKDFNNGIFYNRDFVHSGGSEEDMKITFPLTAMEQKRAFKECWDSKETVYEFYITVADVINCTYRTCEETCNRNPEDIQDECYNALIAIIQESFRFEKFSVLNLDATTEEVWSTTDRMEDLKANSKITEYNQLGDRLIGYVHDPAGVDIVAWGEGIPNIRGASSVLYIKTCDKNEVQWSLNESRGANYNVSESNCDNCS